MLRQKAPSRRNLEMEDAMDEAKRPRIGESATQIFGTLLRRTRTDSDIELDKIGRDMSPVTRTRSKNGIPSLVGPLTRFVFRPADTTSTAQTSNLARPHADHSNSKPANTSTSNLVRLHDDQPNSISKTHINDLPDEVLEEIFCSLPTADLVRYSQVCRRFHGVILNGKFEYLPWKKLYSRYSYGEETAVHRVHVQIRQELARENQPLWIEHLIKFVSTILKLNQDESARAEARLQLHPSFPAAVDIVKKVFATGSGAQEENGVNLGSLLATMILLCDSVEGMSKIIRILTSSPGYCRRMYWIEYFYCLLTLFYAYSRLSILRDGPFHYQFKYAVYLYENDSAASFQELATKASTQPSTAGGQTSLDKFVTRSNRAPTYEQYRIIGCDLQPDDCVRIIAFAGTGKTTTLIEYCRIRPKKKYLIIFFNRSMAEDAVYRFPKNATCSTIHRLAFREIGRRYKGKFRNDLSMESIINTRRCTEIKGLDRYVRAQLIRETLGNYFASDREDITSLFVPERRSVPVGNGEYEFVSNDMDLKLKIVEQAEKVWEAMKDTTYPFVPMTHDGYLKLYQLMQPHFKGGYDAVLVDEAQDCTPAVLDIVKRQQMPKILVGDGYQQIYSFRGAVNALDLIPATKTFYLTRSFRFGPEIAMMANFWMRSVLREEKKFLIGSDKPSRLDGNIEGQSAMICRTNFTVFKESLVIAQREQRQCLAIGNGDKPFDFESLEALHYLYLSDKSREKQSQSVDAEMETKPPDHYFCRMFKSFQAAKDYAQKVNDAELLGKINIIERYKLGTVDCIRSIRNCLVPDLRMAKFVVTTAHKAKGLEFSTVRLANDFSCDPDDPFIQYGRDEYNLVYVAMTRAVNSLILNDSIYEILLRRAGPVLLTPAVYSGVEAVCTRCGTNSSDSGQIRRMLQHKVVAITHEREPGCVAKSRLTKLCKECVRRIMEDNVEPKQKFYQDDATNPAVVIELSKVPFRFYYPLL